MQGSNQRQLDRIVNRKERTVDRVWGSGWVQELTAPSQPLDLFCQANRAGLLLIPKLL